MTNNTEPTAEPATSGDETEIGGWVKGPIITPDGGGIKSDTPEPDAPDTGPVTVPSTGGKASGVDGFTSGPVEPAHTDDASGAPVPPANPYADAVIVNDQTKP